MPAIIVLASIFAALGVFIGLAWSILIHDVEALEASWFADRDKWVYRNPFA